MSVTDAVGPLGAVKELKESDFFPRKKATVLHETSGFWGFFILFFLLKNIFLVLQDGMLEHTQRPGSFI